MPASKWDESFIDIARGLRRAGCDLCEIDKALGISKKSRLRYGKAYPKFARALKEGEKASCGPVVNALYKRALGYQFTKHKKKQVLTKEGELVWLYEETTIDVAPDHHAAMFILCNRDPEHWQRIPDKNIDDEELAEIILDAAKNTNTAKQLPAPSAEIVDVETS